MRSRDQGAGAGTLWRPLRDRATGLTGIFTKCQDFYANPCLYLISSGRKRRV